MKRIISIIALTAITLNPAFSQDAVKPEDVQLLDRIQENLTDLSQPINTPDPTLPIIMREIKQVKEAIDNDSEKWVKIYNLQKDIMVGMSELIDKQTVEISTLRASVNLLSKKVGVSESELQKNKDAFLKATNRSADDPLLKIQSAIERSEFQLPEQDVAPVSPMSQHEKKLLIQQISSNCEQSTLSSEHCETLVSLYETGGLDCALDNTCQGENFFASLSKHYEKFDSELEKVRDVVDKSMNDYTTSLTEKVKQEGDDYKWTPPQEVLFDEAEDCSTCSLHDDEFKAEEKGPLDSKWTPPKEEKF